MMLPVLRLDSPAAARDAEWLVTNGIGGYASGTVTGGVTRRYHGLLVAALPNPLGRVVMLSDLDEQLPDGTPLHDCIDGFSLDGGLPVWSYRWKDAVLERRIVMPYRQNTIVIRYAAREGATQLHIRPAVAFRGYEEPVNSPPREHSVNLAADGCVLACDDYPPLTIAIEGATHVTADIVGRLDRYYPVEEARGYEAHGGVVVPISFIVDLGPGDAAALIASAEPHEVMRALSADEAWHTERARRSFLLEMADPRARCETGAQLVIAADQFLIRPVGRAAEAARADARGDEIRTVIAGYHWFTDWGRDTMISLEGLTLATGRHREAAFVLRTFARYVRDGLIPNMFPDGSDLGLYHTADATLWYFHALHRYTTVTGRTALVAETLPVLREIVESHLRGTRFGIGADPADGLLRQGEEGYQLTWMDAKVDGWVVTPRRGKAVEINALWHNALCLMAGWEHRFGDREKGSRLSDLAGKVKRSFNARFWSDADGYLFDVVDGPNGDDNACRPNQLLAMSLDHPVLEESRWQAVVEVARERLLTPVGLRSLAPGHPEYKDRYFGDLRARDAAYHQGTVWAWLIGPWIDAYLKVYPDERAEARAFLNGLVTHLPEFGVGSIAEIFDAEHPFTARGCIAQAWSVAEALRCWIRTATAAEPR